MIRIRLFWLRTILAAIGVLKVGGFPLAPAIGFKRSLFRLSDAKSSYIQEFLEAFNDSLECETFQSFILRGLPKKAAKERDRGSIRQVDGRLIQTKKDGSKVHVTFKYHGATDIAKNWDVSKSGANLKALLNGDTPTILPASEWGPASCTTRSATLETINTVWELMLGKLPSLSSHNTTTSTTKSLIQSHDRVKKLLNSDDRMWQALGVTNARHQLKPNMSSKFRQCRKFVEIVSHLVDGPVNVVDMGCGRGIDVRPKLVKEISDIAVSLGSDFDGLSFETGTIESYLAESETPDVLIALHACDTATDDALWCGISRYSKLIVVAPCCQKQLRPQLNAAVASDSEHPYADILRHNIYRERFTETVTDSLRALLLEYAGYVVQVFEFVGGEHTSKNVMITAVYHGIDEQKKQLVKHRIQKLADLHGIKQQKLAEWMNVPLSLSDSAQAMERNGQRLSASKMPPLNK